MARAKTRLKIPGFCPIIFEEQSGGVTVREKMCAKNLYKSVATKVVQLPSIWVRGPKEITTQEGEARDGR